MTENTNILNSNTLQIQPISEENKGRFNKRIISINLTSGYAYNHYMGATDTGREVWIFDFDNIIVSRSEGRIGISYPRSHMNYYNIKYV